ncbi:MAG: YggT family protein [Chloroflexi bacterium]|nr:YggT family protein [Chloroflexota bacterium]
MEERTERTDIIETTPTTREVTRVPRATTEVRRVDRPAAEVDRREAVAYDPFAGRRQAAYRTVQVVYWLFGLVEGLIAIRFVLKALGANASAGFAEFIYGLTAPLVAPFYGLFGNPAAQGSVLELHSIVALIVYALLAWLIGKLVWILMGESRSAVTTRETQIDSRL